MANIKIFDEIKCRFCRFYINSGTKWKCILDKRYFCSNRVFDQ